MSKARVVFGVVLAGVVVWQAAFAANAWNAGNRVAAGLFAVAAFSALMILAASRRPT